jgi:hypothetical protein
MEKDAKAFQGRNGAHTYKTLSICPLHYRQNSVIMEKSEKCKI